MANVVEARGLKKYYGETVALDGLDVTVREGTVLGLLGPNGAGKTTVVRILATLLKADAGTASVAGFDVATDPGKVRSMIGVTGQYAAVDELLTARENLELVGRFNHLGRIQYRSRAIELLERLELTDAADRPVKEFSGGMRRRVDIAMSLVAEPKVLFLDEPTTGLDPRSRLEMWSLMADLKSQGMTTLLTTQYLDEADFLSDNIMVIEHGRAIAEGTADELKDRVGGARATMEMVQGAPTDGIVSALGNLAKSGAKPVIRGAEVSIAVHANTTSVDLVRALDRYEVAVTDVRVTRPTLDDVFMTLTGHAAEGSGADQ